ncbi:hypothetical protein KVT40_002191 [Elsinoe batatas]|uniref:FAD-binding domain-containing protein n=1 Tax=Elsinoe batatas TaxID=2601811 RepID=A0A8K0PJI9_9PEZI|nr:hypothetical protein KVT40_002191 [Elsinoe batatas]
MISKLEPDLVDVSKVTCLGGNATGPAYPTNSLKFLNKISSSSSPLNVLVVGAGLGGLATAIALAKQGHQVEVLEQAKRLGEVGAGIQIPPNSASILLEWGLGAYLQDRVVEPESITFRRWESGKAIGYTALKPDFRQKFSAPYHVVHRADFHEALHRLAVDHGVTVTTDSKVVKYIEEDGEVVLATGDRRRADLVIAADGIRSLARPLVDSSAPNSPIATGFAAYRATVPVSKMLSDPATSWLLDTPNINIWIGPLQHVMTYSISSGSQFNLVLSHHDISDPATWSSASQEKTLADMKRYFQNWDPRLVALIDKIEVTMKWPLLTVPNLQKWTSEYGKLVVLGDAAHAMLPYMSEGAAMAIEDAAALGVALQGAGTEDLLERLAVFERVRSLRAGQMQRASAVNGVIWHLDDGDEQRTRDRLMEAEVKGEVFAESPNQWSDPVTQKWAYGYDATWEMEQALASV